MAHAILMPKPGQMTEECSIVAWHKTEGDQVRRGDVLFEIETDKSNMDVEAFEEGVELGAGKVAMRRVDERGMTADLAQFQQGSAASNGCVYSCHTLLLVL